MVQMSLRVNKTYIRDTHIAVAHPIQAIINVRIKFIRKTVNAISVADNVAKHVSNIL